MNRPKSFVTFLIIFLLAGVIGITYYATSRPQELRQKAATPTGPASLILTPSATQFTVGKAESIKITASVADLTLDGYQVIAKLEGVIPPDLVFVPEARPGVQIVSSELIDAPGGKSLTLAAVTTDPEEPIEPDGTFVSLGEFRFTPQSTGTFSVQFDQTLTKITRNNSPGEDILAFPTDVTYTVGPPSGPTCSPLPNQCNTVPYPDCVALMGVPQGGWCQPLPMPTAITCSPLPNECIKVPYPDCVALMGVPQGGWCQPTPTPMRRICPYPPGDPRCADFQPTPTPTQDSKQCLGKVDGTSCSVNNCPVCAPNQPCPQMICTQQIGTCQGGRCAPMPSPTRTPTATPTQTITPTPLPATPTPRQPFCPKPPPCNGLLQPIYPPASSNDPFVGVSCPIDFRCIPNVTPTPIASRPNLCQSSTISGSTLTASQPLRVTLNALNPVSQFRLAFYNLDNLYENASPKPIMWEPGKAYTQGAVYPAPQSSGSFTVSLTDLNHPDLNNAGRIPTRVQVNGYFVDGQGRLSLPDPNCVEQFTVSVPQTPPPRPTVTPTPPRPTTPSPTPPIGCYYQQVQCIQAPCPPILVCATPAQSTPTPTPPYPIPPAPPTSCIPMPPGCNVTLPNGSVVICDPPPGIQFCSTTPTPSPRPVNRPPQIMTRALPQGNVGARYIAQVIASDQDITDTVSMTATRLPSGLQFICNQQTVQRGAQSTCTILGVPTARGAFTVRIQARDSQGSTTNKEFQLIIAGRRAPFRFLQPLFNRLPF